MNKDKLATGLKWAIGLAAVLAAGAAVVFIVQGVIALSLLALTVGAVVYGAPVAAMKLANWSLGAQKNEARANPIETRQNMAVQMRKQLDGAAQALTDFKTEVANFKAQVVQLKRDQPDDSDGFDTQVANLERLQAVKEQALIEARTKVAAFEKATERAARKWKVALAAQRMNKLSGAAQDNAMQELLAAESLDSVETEMNRALAQLDTALLISDSSASTAIPLNITAREGVRS